MHELSALRSCALDQNTPAAVSLSLHKIVSLHLDHVRSYQWSVESDFVLVDKWKCSKASIYTVTGEKSVEIF